MSDLAVTVEHVYKKFRKGEMYDTLRDLIPAAVASLLGQRPANALGRKEFWALQDVSFEVRQGEAVGIIGPNGAGKSTVLKLLTRILRPTSGRIEVRGTLSSLIEVGAGMHPDLTGRENVFLIGTLLGMTREQICRRFDEIVEFSGLEEFIDTPVKRYSSGMYARLGFSVAAHVDPDVLIVDEALSVGDYVFQNKCLARMREIIKGGATVIFVSHYLKAVAELCQRSMLLDRGKVIVQGETNQVVNEYLNRGARRLQDVIEKDVYVAGTVVRSLEQTCLRFETGDLAYVDIEVAANAAISKVAVAIHLRDEGGVEIFNTSTERLGKKTLTLAPGERGRITFELRLHLAAGTYHVGIGLYRYDIGKLFDLQFPAATVYVGSQEDVRGIVNLYPRVVGMRGSHHEADRLTSGESA